MKLKLEITNSHTTYNYSIYSQLIFANPHSIAQCLPTTDLFSLLQITTLFTSLKLSVGVYFFLYSEYYYYAFVCFFNRFVLCGSRRAFFAAVCVRRRSTPVSVGVTVRSSTARGLCVGRVGIESVFQLECLSKVMLGTFLGENTVQYC